MRLRLVLVLVLVLVMVLPPLTFPLPRLLTILYPLIGLYPLNLHKIRHLYP